MSTVANSFVFGGLPRGLPAGYGLAPVSARETGVLKVCVVLRRSPKPGEGPLVMLRETLDARVCLGAVADAGGRVHEWLELWVQDLAGLSRAPAVYRESLSNAALDERWARRAAEVERLDQQSGALGTGRLVRTGFESSNPPPTVIDVKAQSPIEGRDARGNPWALCRDEGVLAKNGLQPYGVTLSRHLWQPSLGEGSPVVPVDEAVADPRVLGGGAECAPFNAGGGLMMAQRYAPLSFEQYVDVVGGWESEGGDSEVVLKGIASAASGAGLRPGSGWLMIEGRDGGLSTSAKLVEALHLKLMALAGAAAAVRASIAATQAPMLNVTSRSFRVSLGDCGGALPLWWTARVALCEPGEGVELPIRGTTAKYFVAGRGGGVTIYSPAGVSRAGSGTGWLRLRNVASDDPSGLILEGTLTTQDRVAPGRNDLLWLRFNLGPARVDVYATVDAKGSMAPGEVRIRTLPLQVGPELSAALKGALGVPVPEVSFEILPMLSSPCDLYGLGVLAVRTLLVTKQTPLPMALDEVFSLAGQAANGSAGGESLESRLEGAFAAESRWRESLGPQLVVSKGGTAEEAFAAVPPKLWFGVLASVIRCFTALGPDSRCRDFGDAPAGGLHKVFDGLVDDLYAHLAACRTLIVSDYRLNSEIRAVVRECMGAK